MPYLNYKGRVVLVNASDSYEGYTSALKPDALQKTPSDTTKLVAFQHLSNRESGRYWVFQCKTAKDVARVCGECESASDRYWVGDAAVSIYCQLRLAGTVSHTPPFDSVAHQRRLKRKATQP